MKRLRTKAHTLPSRTSRHTSQNLAKSVLFPTQEEIQFFSPSLLKKLKHPTRKPTRQRQRNSTTKRIYRHGGQERQLVTAVWRNGGCSASYDSFVVGSSAVLRLNFCAKNPPLRQAAKRCKQAY